VRRLAALAAAALLLGASCGGGSSDETKPFLLAFSPAAGDVVSVNLRRPKDVYEEDRLAIGPAFDTLVAAPPRTDALVLDSETGTVGVVDITSLSRLGLESVVPGAAAGLESPAAAMAPAGAFFLVRDAAAARFVGVDATDRSEPVLFAEAALEGGATALVPDRRGAFFLLERGAAGSIGVFDFANPSSPLRVDAVAGAGPLESLEFTAFSDDVAAALDGAGGSVVLIDAAPARSGLPVASAAAPLGLEAGAAPVAWASFHAAPRVAVAADDGRIVLVDAPDPLAPAIALSFDGGVAAGAVDLRISPDDALLSVADVAAGTLRFFDLTGPGEPRLAGSFELGGALEPLGFAPEGDADGFERRPLFFAGVGGSSFVLADVSLRLGGAVLSPEVAFAPLSGVGTYDTKRGPILVGLDSAGRVVRYGLYDPSLGAEAITSADLGLGAAAAAAGVHLRTP